MADGRALPPQFRQFVRGYTVTSYGSQGKTVDHVLFADSSVRAATNAEQWYVTISRGRKSVRIFTGDKARCGRKLLKDIPRGRDVTGTFHDVIHAPIPSHGARLCAHRVLGVATLLLALVGLELLQLCKVLEQTLRTTTTLKSDTAVVR